MIGERESERDERDMFRDWEESKRANASKHSGLSGCCLSQMHHCIEDGFLIVAAARSL